MAVMVSMEGKISFDPRKVGKDGISSYAVSCYNGKDKTTGKSSYMNFDVTDWNNITGGRFKKDDYVKIVGEMTMGTFTAKDGTVKTSMRVVPRSMEVTVAPWDKNSGAGNAIAANTDNDSPF